jgi:hypothetical protein
MKDSEIGVVDVRRGQDNRRRLKACQIRPNLAAVEISRVHIILQADIQAESLRRQPHTGVAKGSAWRPSNQETEVTL